MFTYYIFISCILLVFPVFSIIHSCKVPSLFYPICLLFLTFPSLPFQSLLLFLFALSLSLSLSISHCHLFSLSFSIPLSQSLFLLLPPSLSVYLSASLSLSVCVSLSLSSSLFYPPHFPQVFWIFKMRSPIDQSWHNLRQLRSSITRRPRRWSRRRSQHSLQLSRGQLPSFRSIILWLRFLSLSLFYIFIWPFFHPFCIDHIVYSPSP